MNLFSLFRRQETPPPAATARERLKLVLAHERTDRATLDLVPLLQKDIVEVIAKHLSITDDQVEVMLHNQGETSMLEVKIEIPDSRPARRPVTGQRAVGMA